MKIKITFILLLVATTSLFAQQNGAFSKQMTFTANFTKSTLKRLMQESQPKGICE